MRIIGEWLRTSDDVIRPILRGEVRTADGAWNPAVFLIDTGADRTVFSADVLERLGFPEELASKQLGGIGGEVPTFVVGTSIRFFTDVSGEAVFNGRFAAFREPGTVDVSVLGRDITNFFALIVDRPNDLIALIGKGHGYRIIEESSKETP